MRLPASISSRSASEGGCEPTARSTLRRMTLRPMASTSRRARSGRSTVIRRRRRAPGTGGCTTRPGGMPTSAATCRLPSSARSSPRSRASGRWPAASAPTGSRRQRNARFGENDMTMRHVGGEAEARAVALAGRRSGKSLREIAIEIVRRGAGGGRLAWRQLDAGEGEAACARRMCRIGRGAGGRRLPNAMTVEQVAHHTPITRAGGAKLRYRGRRNAFITVAERDPMLSHALTRRLMNHAPPNDVTGGYAANRTSAQLCGPAQKIANRIDELLAPRPGTPSCIVPPGDRRIDGHGLSVPVVDCVTGAFDASNTDRLPSRHPPLGSTPRFLPSGTEIMSEAEPLGLYRLRTQDGRHGHGGDPDRRRLFLEAIARRSPGYRQDRRQRRRRIGQTTGGRPPGATERYIPASQPGSTPVSHLLLRRSARR